MPYVLIDNGVVVQKQISEQDGFIYAPDEVVCGWQYDGANFTPPPEPVPIEDFKHFTSLEYLDMFSDSEQLAVVTATMTEPSVKLWYDRMLAASFVTYEDPRTEAGLAALVSAGLITAARKSEIVSELKS